LNSLQPPIHIVPHYLVKSKTPVEPGEPAKAVIREDRQPGTKDDKGKDVTTESWARAAEETVVRDFKESTCAVYEGIWNDQCVLFFFSVFLFLSFFSSLVGFNFVTRNTCLFC
jgi:hypothetical protein